MPDKRTHRGQHPADARLFSGKIIPDLKTVVGDFSLLLTKGYADKSSLKLVGDRFALTERQRLAIMRSACSDVQLELRRKSQIEIGTLAGKDIAIDGYNCLITIEAAMSGGFIFKGRDGCLRDLASIHGTYRKVAETVPAVELIGEFLKGKDIDQGLWLLDRPVSNSGRLKMLITEIAEKNQWKWKVKLSMNPDAELKKSNAVVVSSDSVVISNCQRWVNLTAEIIKEKLPETKIVDLST